MGRLSRADPEPGSVPAERSQFVTQRTVEMHLTLNAGDWDALLALYDADIEIRDLQHAPNLPEVLHGLEGARDFAAQWVDANEEFGAEVTHYVDADPWVVTQSRWHGRGRGSDVAVEFRDGKVVRLIVG
jgi:hypothetical protein